MKALLFTIVVFLNFNSHSTSNNNKLYLNEEPILLSIEQRSTPEEILSAPVLITLHTNEKEGSQAFLDFRNGEEINIPRGFTFPVIRDFTSSFFEVINIGKTPFRLGYFCNSTKATVKLPPEGGKTIVGPFKSVGMPLTKTSKMFYRVSGPSESISVFAIFVGSGAPLLYVLNPLKESIPSFYNQISGLKVINSNRFNTVFNALGSTVSIVNISSHKEILKVVIY